MFVQNADSLPLRLGRVGAHLPPETLLVQFLENVDAPPSSFFKTTKISACEWYGVHCNDAQKVEKIDWHAMHSAHQNSSAILGGRKLRGTLRWEHLPATLLELQLYTNYLTGAVTLDALPRDLQSLNLASNTFSGTLDFADLPRTMIYLNFSFNDFQRALHFECLPQAVHELNLECNENLKGMYVIKKLPRFVRISIRETRIRAIREQKGACLIM